MVDSLLSEKMGLEKLVSSLNAEMTLLKEQVPSHTYNSTLHIGLHGELCFMHSAGVCFLCVRWTVWTVFL